MPVDLVDKYPQYEPNIRAARARGISDSQIESHLVNTIGVRPVEQVEETFFSALQKNVKTDPEGFFPTPIQAIFNAIDVPQDIITAALSRDDKEGFLSRFARGQDPSETLGIESTAGQLITDAILDPINLLGGAGAISKISRASKLVKEGASVKSAIKEVTKRAAKKEADEASTVARDSVEFKEFEPPADAVLRTGVRTSDEIIDARNANKLPDDELIRGGQEAKDGVLSSVMSDLYDPQTASVIERSGLRFGVADNILEIADDVINERTNKLLKALRLSKQAEGQALRANQLPIKISKEVMDEIRNKFNALPGGPVKERLAELLDAVGLNKRDINPTLLDKFVEWATMVKLTGMSTHIRGIVGNSSILFFRPLEKFTAGAADALRAKAGFMGGAEQNVFMREATAEAMGVFKAIPDAIHRAMQFLQSPDKYFNEATKAGEVLLKGGAIGKGGRAGDALSNVIEKASGIKGVDIGGAIRLPGRFIGAVDVFFRHLNFSGEVYAQATRLALKKGLKRDEIIEDVFKSVTDKSFRTPFINKIRETAELSARERVFQEELPKFAKTLNILRKKHPIARLIVPFFNTAVNLFKQSLQRTPLALVPIFRKSWKNVWNPTLTPEVRAEMLGRALTGSMFMAGVAWAGLEGRITGRGTKSKARNDLLRLTGWQPNSVKVGNAYISYQGFEPLTSWFRTIADATDAKTRDGELRLDPDKLVFSYVQQFAENPFLMGVNDVFEALRDPEKKASRFMAGLITGSTIPVILQQWGKTVYDPVVREPKTFIERVKARVPFGPSTTVSAKRNIFGEEIERDLRGIPSAFGFTMSFKKGGKMDIELSKMVQGEDPITLGAPSRSIGAMTLSEEEYSRMFVLRGSMIKTTLEKLINHPHYEKMPLEARKRAVNRIVFNINRFAKSDAFRKYITRRQ